jgi:hypothetical protein
VAVVAEDHVGVILAAGRPAPHLMVGHGDALAIRDVEDTANSSCGGSAPSGKSLAACLLAALASLAVVAGGAECSGRAARSRARAEALRARRGIGRIPERLAQIQGRAEVMGHQLGAVVATCGELLDPIETSPTWLPSRPCSSSESSASAMEHDGVVPALLVILAEA